MNASGSGRRTVALTTLLAPPVPCRVDDAPEVDCFDMAGFERAEPVVQPAAAVAMGSRLVEPGDVLVSLRAPRRAWVVGASRGRPQAASADWLVLRSEALDPGYARHVLVSNAFDVACRGSAPHRRHRQADAQRWAMDLVLPSRADQARAARIMDQADALRSQRALVIGRSHALAATLFVERFGLAPQTRYPSRPLSSCLRAPLSRGADVGIEAHGRFAVIRAANLVEGAVSLHGAGYVSRSDAALARSALADGDVLLARRPGHPEVRVAVARPGDAVWFTHATLWRLRVEPTQMLPEYLRAWFESPAGQRGLVEAWRSVPSRVPVEQRLAAVAVPIPPIEMQQQFAERVNAADRLMGRVQASAERFDALLGTLRDLAYRGELEPA